MNEISYEEMQQYLSVCLDEIVLLKGCVDELSKKNENQEILINELINSQKKIIDGLNQSLSSNEYNRQLINKAVDNIQFELNLFDDDFFFVPSFYSIEETIDVIVKSKASIARFGDGEFDLMSGLSRHKFQSCDERLSKRLKEIIKIDEERFLVGVANHYGSLESFNENGKQGIRSYMSIDVRKRHMSFLEKERKYHNAYITRPYALWNDNVSDEPRKRFMELKRIWQDREVVMIEGEKTRLGVGNDLFENAASIKRIEAPAVNAYEKYEKILSVASRCAAEETLFLIALGPTASVLAYDLYKLGYQAVDIGHLDLEYEWFLKGTGSRCEVKTKYNNEVLGGDIVEDVFDEKYMNEIIERVI